MNTIETIPSMLPDMANSEYGAIQTGVLTISPDITAIKSIKTPEDMEYHNWFGMPDPEELIAQNTGMINKMKELGANLVYIMDLLPDDPELITEKLSNPNFFFVRDSTFTAPFLGNIVVKAKMGLEPRKKEPGLIVKGLAKYGLQGYELSLDEDDHFEGGDVMPVCFDGKSTLLVGLGERTTLGAAKAMASELAVDQVIAIKHPENILHLDTGLALFDGAALMAEGMFEMAALISKNGNIEELDMVKLLEANGFNIVTVSQEAAVKDEVCNVLALGAGKFLGFDEMGMELKKMIESYGNNQITTVPGDLVAKAAGGAHCSGRPFYIVKNN